MVSIRLTKLFLLFLNDHLNLCLYFLSQAKFTCKLSFVSITWFQSLEGYFFCISRICELKLSLIDMFRYKESKNKKLFSMVIITYWGIVDIVEIFSHQFEDDLIEHDFPIFICLNCLCNQNGNPVILLFESFLLKDNIDLLSYNLVPLASETFWYMFSLFLTKYKR